MLSTLFKTIEKKSVSQFVDKSCSVHLIPKRGQYYFSHVDHSWLHLQNSKNFYPGTRHWRPVIMKTTERLNLPPFSWNTVFNNNICKDEQRTSFSNIWTGQSYHNAHLFGKIGNVEVRIFNLNKTNNQIFIMVDMFQNVNLQTGVVCGISQ